MNRRGARPGGAAFALLLLIAFLALPARAATLAGTIVIEATVAIRNNVAAKTAITVEGEATIFDAVGGHSVFDTVPLKWSGGSASVRLVLPYLWSVANAAETMSVTLFVFAATPGLPTSSMTAVIALPKNGSTAVVKLPGII